MGVATGPAGIQYWIFAVISPVVLVSLIIPLFLVWKNRRSNRALIYLFLLVVDSSGWLVLNTLELLASTEYWTLVWARLSYPFITALPALWFLFARVYEGAGMNIKKRTLALFFIEPVITCIFVFYTPWSRFVWRSVEFVQVSSFLTLRVHHGPWFWVHISYVYFFLAYGSVLIFLESLKRRKLFKKQAFWMILGAFIPFAVNCIYIFGLIPGLVKDYTPPAFMFSGIAFIIGIFRFSLLELIPIARTTVVEHMKDGIIILDPLDRVIDINRSASEAIGYGESIVGCRLDILEESWPELSSSVRDKKQPVRLKKEIAGTERFFLIDYTPIEVRSGLIGWVLEMRDITDEIALLKRIEHMAKTDELTGLPNRRNFSDIAKNEITRSARYGTSLSAVMLDLDHFKDINDTMDIRQETRRSWIRLT